MAIRRVVLGLQVMVKVTMRGARDAVILHFALLMNICQELLLLLIFP